MVDETFHEQRLRCTGACRRLVTVYSLAPVEPWRFVCADCTAGREVVPEGQLVQFPIPLRALEEARKPKRSTRPRRDRDLYR